MATGLRNKETNRLKTVLEFSSRECDQQTQSNIYSISRPKSCFLYQKLRFCVQQPRNQVLFLLPVLQSETEAERRQTLTGNEVRSVLSSGQLTRLANFTIFLVGGRGRRGRVFLPHLHTGRSYISRKNENNYRNSIDTRLTFSLKEKGGKRNVMGVREGEMKEVIGLTYQTPEGVRRPVTCPVISLHLV